MTEKQARNAKEFFDTHPSINEVYSTEDGSLFLKANREDAKEHARHNNMAKPVIITRVIDEENTNVTNPEIVAALGNDGDEKEASNGVEEKDVVEEPVKKLPDNLIDNHKL